MQTGEDEEKYWQDIAVEELGGLNGPDFEKNHIEADKILLKVLRGSGIYGVVAAYEEAEKRCHFVCS